MLNLFNRKARLPTFLLVGAHKAATTAFFEYSRQHPQVYMPKIKEPRFFAAEAMKNVDPALSYYKPFNKNLVTTIERYTKLYKGADSATAIGDASPQYLYYHDVAIPRIKSVLGDPKIVIILRNPIDRALSAYRYLLARGATSEAIETIIAGQDDYVARFPPFYHIIPMGFYAAAVSQFKTSFSQTLIMLYDDVVSDLPGCIRKYYQFIGVDSDYSPPQDKRYNATSSSTTKKPNSVFKQLLNLYETDITELSQVLNIDLEHWKKAC